MTLLELQFRVSFEKISYGTWRVYRRLSRGRYCYGITHDSLAVDRVTDSSISPSSRRYGYTLKQAYEALLSCVIRDRIFDNPKIRR